MDITGYVSGITANILNQTLPNTIPPTVVGQGYIDLANLTKTNVDAVSATTLTLSGITSGLTATVTGHTANINSLSGVTTGLTATVSANTISINSLSGVTTGLTASFNSFTANTYSITQSNTLFVKDPLVSDAVKILNTIAVPSAATFTDVVQNNANIFNTTGAFTAKGMYTVYTGVSTKAFNTISFPIVRDVLNNLTFTDVINLVMIFRTVKYTATITLAQLAPYNLLTSGSTYTSFDYNWLLPEPIYLNAG